MPIARAKERGLCVDCGKPAVPGRVRCEPCRETARRRAAEWRASDPAKHKRYAKGWVRTHVAKGTCRRCNDPAVEGRSMCERHLAYAREKAAQRYHEGKTIEVRKKWRALNHEGAPQYGLTREEYERLCASQGHRCAICGAKDAGGRGGFHIDHDHRFERGDRRGVRGVLCQNCNTALGRFGDDLAGLRRALEYLEKFEEGVRPRLVGSV